MVGTLILLVITVSTVVLVNYHSATRIPPSSGGASAPTVVRITSLGVTTQVTPIQMTGPVLDPPEDPMLAGWVMGTAMPGAETGSAVVTAHKIHGGGGAFDELAKVKRGSLISVDTERGVQNYGVSSVKDLNLEEFAAAAPGLFRTDGPPRLVLITCWGWNGKGWDGNTVVVAEPQSEV